MPELPDVEGHRRTFEEHCQGKTPTRVEVPDAELLEGTTPQGLGNALRGTPFIEPRRHGKWLFAPTAGGPTLVFHFRMTGELAWTEESDEYDALVLHFEDGSLRYRSRRRLGRVWFVPTGGDTEDVTGPLGPDATEVDAERLTELLDGRRGGIKSALMDQELIAGLGNELVDEILWRAKIDPRASVADLSEGTVGDIHHHMREVLGRSIRAGHVPSGPNWLNGVRGEDDPSCPRCGAAVETGQVSGRTTYWCSREQ
ncbi:MAG: DNA-formamidopyrimidine glycosylase family protein [Nitriliruptorales bacterium]|nr:DNA-formamidopyrimidine glycosylase family protein [Nitriliruptorales bacterium]